MIHQNEEVFQSRDSGLNYIEQLQELASKPCTNDSTPYLIGVNENEQKLLLTKASCKSWGCETCGARNARLWIAKVIFGCNQQDCTWSFLTLTAHAKQRLSKSVGNLRGGWKKISNRIRDEQGKRDESLLYCRVWEQHLSGSFHLHILINCCLGTRWAKDTAAACGLGYQAEWHEVGNVGMVAGYMAKYSLKNATIARGGVEWPKGLRRIETSRNWPKLPPKVDLSGYGWAIVHNREFQLVKASGYDLRGYEVIDLTEKSQSAAE